MISRWQSQEQRKWWVKIVTKYPACTYYFGPFDTVQEAQGSQLDYSQDLQDEGAQITTIKVQKCQPRQLTICQE
ncbi:DUF1816 domain-containing protein [Gloeothece citriformis]|uniref:DUF1816 domain-containing protein n=1 Tax=Gloeothece citriformis TaxID=2546356 RepID=UPI0002F33D4A|nr:DUF1816 domain-containing protein [Gloeothece citriformis]